MSTESSDDMVKFGRIAATMQMRIAQLESQLSEARKRLASAKRLQEMTLENELRWMRKHEDLLKLIASLRHWKSPDGVLQAKDLKWFAALNATPERAGETQPQGEQKPKPWCRCPVGQCYLHPSLETCSMREDAAQPQGERTDTEASR